MHLPSGDVLEVYDAAQRYQQDGWDTVVVAGAEYGTGSSRDWAAKGTKLLGIKAVIAKSFERIHRSNLAGMGCEISSDSESTDHYRFHPSKFWDDLGVLAVDPAEYLAGFRWCFLKFEIGAESRTIPLLPSLCWGLPLLHYSPVSYGRN